MRNASDAPLTRLTRELQKLRNFHLDPFAVFVTEALRHYGGAVPDPAPADESVPTLRAALAAYHDAVADAPPFMDLLGPIYMEFMGTNKQQWGGMFYTPWTLAVAKTRLVRVGWEPRPKPDGELWRMQEPACGCGALVLAWLACLVEDFGPDALHLWSIQAIDRDLTALRACALQVVATLAHRVWGIGEFQVLHGDTLRLEFYACPWHSRLQPYVRLLETMLTAIVGSVSELRTESEVISEPARVAAITACQPLNTVAQPHGAPIQHANRPLRRDQLDIFEEAA